ncbi:discoidin domain-containing protein [Rhodoferax sp.]|uniref:discoidin domain-containing protein n=1 Tax=Rhodoferax sp. TaxID=50421 RepID=UPI0025F5C50F|nr:discoidin domain-containing protein [Rhodoferax sp.]
MLALALGLVACGGESTDTVEQGRAKAAGVPIAAFNKAKWGGKIDVSLTPASAANLPNGNVMLWAADGEFMFSNGDARAYATTYNPTTGGFTKRLVNETGSNLFCPGTSMLADGRLLVSGGSQAGNTSIYNSANDTWAAGAALNITRAYNANALLQDGSVLTLGGSWNGGQGGKHGEVWTEATGWKRLTGVPVDDMVGPDPAGVYRGDNHMWLLPTGNGQILHAGPSAKMHWIDTRGNGNVRSAGNRGDDAYSMSGNTVMYDIGKILKVGGSPAYQDANATASSYLIDVNAGVQVRKIAPMSYARAFHNSVVLPNGQVIVIGGQSLPVPFSDNTSVLVPELFDPATETFTALPPMTVPRNYHSVALLLPDARVMSAGGGLCGNGCAGNHPNIEILSPHYLFNADGSPATRPVITAAPTQTNYGAVANVTSNAPVTAFALVRMSSTTHTVNNDQRRIPLSFTPTGANSYALNIPTNPGWALPGYYMLFAMDSAGVPSVAKTVLLSQVSAPLITPVDDQSASLGSAVSLVLQARNPTGVALAYRATGLPPGLVLNANTGTIQGTPSTLGRYPMSVEVGNGVHRISTEFVWTVREPGQVQFVKLEALGEVNNNPWSSMAEFNLLDEAGVALNRTGWTIQADSQQAGNSAELALDGDPQTFWHTAWGPDVPLPHSVVVDMGSSQKVSGMRYLPRPGGGNGTIAKFRVYFSADGINWGTPVAQSNLTDYGAADLEKTVYFNNVAAGKPASQSSTAGKATAALVVDRNQDGVLANGGMGLTGADTNAWWEVDLGSVHSLTSLRLWNRTDCCAANLANFYVLVSSTPMAGRTLDQLLADTKVWHSALNAAAPRSLALAALTRGRYMRVQLAGNNALGLAEVEVYGTAIANRAPSLATPTVSPVTLGQAVTLNLSGNDPDGDALVYTATGLPPGLVLQPASGVVSGTTSAVGLYNVTATATDTGGLKASASFVWSVMSPPVTIAPIAATPSTSNASVAYTATVAGSGPYQYQWNYGDGSPVTAFGTSATATHTYAAPGLYTVQLTVRSSDGTTSTRSFVQAVTAAAVPGAAKASSNLVLEPRSGASVRLWVVNPDNDTVSVFDTATNARLAEIAVAAQPRTLALAPDGRVWVVNRGGASISIISPGTLAVVQTVALARGGQPYGVVLAANGSAYVALEGLGQLLKLSAAGVVQGTLNVGPNPRHIALTADGNTLLVSRFITRPQPGEATATVQTTLAGAKQGGELVVVDPATMAIRRTVVLQHSDKADSTTQGRGVPNYLGAAALSPDGASAWVPSKQDNIQRGLLRDKQNLDFQNTVRAISSRIAMAGLTEDYAARVDHDNSGLASAAVYHPSGAYVFVTLEASRHLAVLDASGRRELFRVDTGRAPQGVVVSADGKKLYVHNFMDRSVGVYDLSPLAGFGQMALPLLATMGSVGTEKLAADVLAGKQFFYDARDTRLARDGYMSCATCHNDGGHDGRTWDFTGRGEGLRNTIRLQGRAGGQGPLHWSGNFDEGQDFEGQIRSLAQGTGLMTDAQFNTGTRSAPLGDKKAGVSADLDAMAAYMASLNTFEPSPWRNNGVLTSAALTGQGVFNAQCASCHGGATFTNSTLGLLKNVGTLKPGSGKRLDGVLTGIDIPTLRDAWLTAPYLHDGSAATIDDAVRAHTTLTLSAADVASVSAFVQQIGSEAVGVSVGRYVKFEMLGEFTGQTWSSMAEFNLLGANGAVLNRTGWTATADSAELVAEDSKVANILDGNTSTFWHSQWYNANPLPPHWVVVDMHAVQPISGFRYTPRTGGGNGTVAAYRLFVSVDGVTWGSPVVQGDLKTLGAANLEKTVRLGGQ